MINEICKILKHGFSCSGRANRKEFLIFNAVYILFYFITAMYIPFLLDDDLPLLPNDSSNKVILIAALCINIISGFASLFLNIRRLHDINASGCWLLLIIFVPLFGDLFSIALFFIKGTNGANQYGDQP